MHIMHWPTPARRAAAIALVPVLVGIAIAAIAIDAFTAFREWLLDIKGNCVAVSTDGKALVLRVWRGPKGSGEV